MPSVKPTVREYRLHRLVCPYVCSRAGVVPDGVAGQDGPRLRAVLALLTGAFRLSKMKASRLWADLSNIPMSAGQICSLEASFAEKLRPLADEIRAAVPKRPANVDETSMGK